ncbi:MAG: hypothetical protein A2Z69_02655 [Bacteroidetes bacterium RBG_13_44_24]|nr:MAG: hypothetical protein A2Z69_02655 [Bacteroidetes bacterium RBG_13_44_24]
MNELIYKVVFSRRKSISITVTPDKGVIVRAPYGVSSNSIDKFVREKEGWIRKHTDKYSGITRLNNNKKYIDGETHLFMGKECRLKIIYSTQLFVNQYDNIIEVGTDGKDGRVKMMLDRWYRKKAGDFISGNIKEILNRYSDHGFFPSALVVKPLKSRWGSCTSKGKLTISSELIKIDPVFAEYVIIHELCHLKNHNHGKEFYRLLEELYPDYKTVRKDLRKYITK